jgi:type IV pilus assembly protein PilB
VLLVDSLKRGASDIHIEPYEKEFRVRFRIDGILYNVMALPMKLKDPLTRAQDHGEARHLGEAPAAGRPHQDPLKVEDRSRDLDFRVSCLPTLWGEKIVLRLLDKSKLMLDMTKLGFEPHSLERFKTRSQALRDRAGHGPDRLGQDQHALLGDRGAQQARHQHHDGRGPGRVQPSGHQPGPDPRQHRLNFAAVLRSFLRQDPNIIMVGEIRDYETAEIAVKAALTGHLVLSTLHTTTPRRRSRAW